MQLHDFYDIEVQEIPDRCTMSFFNSRPARLSEHQRSSQYKERHFHEMRVRLALDILFAHCSPHKKYCIRTSYGVREQLPGMVVNVLLWQSVDDRLVFEQLH